MTRPAALLLALLRRADGLLLLALGAAMGAFALSDRYVVLLNASFRWVTLSGAVLITGMGLALTLTTRRRPRPLAVLAYATLIPLVAIAQPYSAASGLLLAPDLPAAGIACGDGYEDLRLESLFVNLSEEARDVAEIAYVVPGVVHRTAELDAQSAFLLYEPSMACCLADAIAYAVQVHLPPGTELPERRHWHYVCGTLRRLPTPLTTGPTRIGAIMFAAISRHSVLDADRVVTFRSLLEDAGGMIPDTRCAAFRAALEKTGLLAELKGEGPFTVFAPLDLGIERVFAAHAETGFDPEDPARLRRYLEGFIVRGNVFRKELYSIRTLETLSGRRLDVEVRNGVLRVEGARVLFADQVGRNGVVHVVHPPWAPEGR